ncbi:MAG: NAD(P)-dependent dehydrogenase (short-subunit alcohol dehydrogenase family) [Aureispira sp.]|jgi:NAD(P)-dependent dehydrogenase (short-subunit alcohol dehydrogenase family)
MTTFDLDKISSQKGRIAIITGANIGLGFETALGLAKKEMTVVLACRNIDKATAAKQEILKEVPNADLDIIQIDLSSLDSVRKFAKNYLKKYQQLDLLINNAGVMMPPFSLTKDGFELQMAANCFGHFLLTGLLLETILATPNSRIVSLSSIAHRSGKINFDDLQSQKKYSAAQAYGQSKLACLMYGYELQRRLDAAGHTSTISTIAHPGLSDTNLGQHLPKWAIAIASVITPLISHSAKAGAQPSLLAAVGAAKGGDYFGPAGFKEMKGKPGKAKSTSLSKDKEVAKKLWEVSEKLTGITYSF